MRYANWFLALISSAILLICPLGYISYATPKIKIVSDMGVKPPVTAPKGKAAVKSIHARKLGAIKKILKTTNKKAKKLEKRTAELILILKELKAKQKARAKTEVLPKGAKS